MKLFRRLVQRSLPKPVRLAILHATRWPPIGRVEFGGLRRLKPVSEHWGGDRGLPIDRYYIERFLSIHASDIRGRVLEIGENTYTRRFGGKRIVQSDVLHAAEGNSQATFVADLAHAEPVPSDAFDCMICTQTLQLIPDLKAAIRTIYRILKPGGVLLATVPGISKLYRSERNQWGDYWRFTTFSVKWILAESFPVADIHVEAHGNVLTSVAFLHGLATSELTQEELETCDPDYPMLITMRAIKPEV